MRVRRKNRQMGTAERIEREEDMGGGKGDLNDEE